MQPLAESGDLVLECGMSLWSPVVMLLMSVNNTIGIFTR